MFRYIEQLLAEVETLQARVTQLEEQGRRLENSLGEAQDRLGQELAGSARLRAEIAAAQVSTCVSILMQTR